MAFVARIKVHVYPPFSRIRPPTEWNGDDGKDNARSEAAGVMR
jgi:hypothetical protein